MSLQKSATRRLSLLAGSSLAVSLAAFAMAGAAFTPSTAQAADECGNPSANGAAADVLVCPAGAYSTGINYSTTTNGDLTVVLRDRVNTGTSNTAGSGPITMFGKVGEDMSLIREDTPGAIGDPRIVNTTGTGRAIDLSTQGDGNILINLTDGDPAAGEPTTPAATAPAPLRVTASTDAIRAQATGTGNVSVTIAETGAQSGTNHVRATITAGASGGSGVVARSTSGSINVDTRGAAFSINGTSGTAAIDAASASGNITISTTTAVGRVRGILAQTGGTGAVSLLANGNTSASAVNGIAIDVMTGTGGATIAINSGSVQAEAAGSYAIRAAGTGSVLVNNAGVIGRLNFGVDPVGGRVDFSGVTGAGVTFNNTGVSASNGRWITTGVNTFSAGNDVLSMTGLGQNLLGSGSTVNLGAGNDTFTMNALLFSNSAAIDFGVGSDTFNMGGALAMDGLTISGLEVFNNSGVILMGAGYASADSSLPDFVTSDGVADDVLALQGVSFTGSGSSRILMDVTLADEQGGCAAITAADCLDLSGGSTGGTTLVTANYVGDDAQQSGQRTITLIDVGGGTSAASHFVLDPNSSGYVVDPTFGAVLARPGLFSYGLRYDADNQRHVLVGLPRSEIMEYAMLGGAASSIWHMTTDAVTDRQTDLRAATEGGVVWLRTSGEYTKRDVATAFDSFGEAFTFDNAYKLYAGTVIGGMDLISGRSGDYDYVLGVQLGYVGSSFDLNASESSGRMSGATGGLYGSAWNGVYFFDTAFNTNFLTLDYDSPELGAKTNTYLNSMGAKLEGGRRFALSDNLFVDPLATVAFVNTVFEEISLAGGEVQPDSTQSLRGALGLRLGGEAPGQALNLSYFVAGRAWNEFMGEGGGVVHNPGDDLVFNDDFGGSFTEAEAGLSLYNAANTLSGFLTSGVKSADGYSAVNLSLGLNMRW